jgi:hypothetical protein
MKALGGDIHGSQSMYSFSVNGFCFWRLAAFATTRSDYPAPPRTRIDLPAISPAPRPGANGPPFLLGKKEMRRIMPIFCQG